MRMEMTINGALYYADFPPLKPLSGSAQGRSGFIGPKEGCGEGDVRSLFRSSSRKARQRLPGSGVQARDARY